ncbi:tetrahydromethanopterin S-methyltransferase subunit B [Methanothermococcus sp. SCGC AD-155-N22]|nr:tetrahydromethanopterin S-methyltransferase subunit B [Methanothermococcus sp. SCGC AD-155-N22]
MDIVKVCPELGIVMDVDSGLIAETREDIVMVDLNPVRSEIEKLEKLAKVLRDALLYSLGYLVNIFNIY